MRIERQVRRKMNVAVLCCNPCHNILFSVSGCCFSYKDGKIKTYLNLPSKSKEPKAVHMNIANMNSNNCGEIKNAEASSFQKFKGVVPQQNGNWGAQIYANHQRIWLGTFKSEREAAMAYDSAGIKLRSRESHRNFPWNNQTVQESQFQSHYNAETVLTMIRDGTYPSNFATFLSSRETQGTAKHISVKGEEGFCCSQLFQKELTPSDVGKLNRLVIPKKYAVTYFPYVSGTETDGGVGADVEVVFYDKLMRLWKFRYCYWKSSQSYVFTRGWNRFVKDKKLKPKDVIAFFMCERKCGDGQAFALIDVIYNPHNRVDLKQQLSCSEEDEEMVDDDTKDNFNAQKGFRLFGVSIT